MALLDRSAVDLALLSLPEWSGDTNRLTRTLQTAGPRADRLRAAVMTAADAIDHHPLVEQSDATLTFVVWTHSAGGVTQKDVQLAEIIDSIIERDEHATDS